MVAHRRPARGKSYLAELLLQEVLWGFMAASVAQRLAAAAIADGSCHPDLTVIADVGSRGRYPGNAWRDLERRLLPNRLLSAFQIFRIQSHSQDCRARRADNINCGSRYC